jgi:hypothetical protein
MKAITLAIILAIAMVMFLMCSIVSAATIELPNPTMRQVADVQCGYPSPTPIAAGFSQPGDIAIVVFQGSDSCSLGGRAHMMRRYYGCAVVSYDLTGLMLDNVMRFPPNPDHSCTIPANTLYAAPQSYSVDIGPNASNSIHAFLETP